VFPFDPGFLLVEQDVQALHPVMPCLRYGPARTARDAHAAFPCGVVTAIRQVMGIGARRGSQL
jgi:hypothetical protein